MCLLALKLPAGKLVESEMENAYLSNPDGCGLAWADAGGEGKRLGIWRSHKAPFREFWTMAMKHQNDTVMAHFRLATGGGVRRENCHPFLLSQGMALGHNGVLHCTNSGYTQSDTAILVDLIKALLGDHLDDLITSDPLAKRFGKLIGTNNKIAFLDAAGRYRIVNESLGHWTADGGIWYSNGSYKTSPARYSFLNATDDEILDTDWYREWTKEAERDADASIAEDDARFIRDYCGRSPAPDPPQFLPASPPAFSWGPKAKGKGGFWKGKVKG